MRKYLLLAFLLFGTMECVSAQGKIDTLYYTKDWKKAPNKVFANFYRFAYYPTDSLEGKQYRDYHVTGEMYGSGYFVNIDANDDANSIFDGECVCYFKSGNQASVKSYKNGMLDGRYCVYDETGLIRETGSYSNGQLSGVHTTFNNDNTFVQIEYANGQPAFDYYIKGDAYGHVSKYRIADNTPILETPKISERKVSYKDGQRWQCYCKNGMIVAVSYTTVRDYGKWHRIDIVITNNTMTPIQFDPVRNITANSQDLAGNYSSLKVWSSDEYLKKVKNSQAFAAAMTELAEGMAAANAGYTKTTTTTFHSGRAHAHSNGMHAYGNYSGMSNSTTTSYDAGIAYQARVLSQQRIDNLENEFAEERNIKKLGYLKINTIYPGESISGYVHIQRVQGDSVQFFLNIDGAKYYFNWFYGKK